MQGHYHAGRGPQCLPPGLRLLNGPPCLPRLECCLRCDWSLAVAPQGLRQQTAPQQPLPLRAHSACRPPPTPLRCLCQRLPCWCPRLLMPLPPLPPLSLASSWGRSGSSGRASTGSIKAAVSRAAVSRVAVSRGKGKRLARKGEVKSRQHLVSSTIQQVGGSRWQPVVQGWYNGGT